MSTYYIYVDETGNLDTDETKKDVTPYFGIGTAMFIDDHSRQLWEGTELRIQLEREGIRLPQGLHAVNDRRATRHRVIDLILKQEPVLDATLLKKANAYNSVRRAIEREPTGLYGYAWRFHFDFLMKYKIPKDANVVVIAGTLGTKKQAQLARRSIEDMCDIHRGNREITLCVWDSPTSWGLQVADYAAWSSYQVSVGRDCPYYKRLQPLVRSIYRPWTREGEDVVELTPTVPHGPGQEESNPIEPPNWMKPDESPVWPIPHSSPVVASSRTASDPPTWAKRHEKPSWWPEPDAKPPF